jgi:translocation and assembly module TamB
LSPLPPPDAPEVVSPEAEADPVRARKLEVIKRRWSRRHIGTVGFLALLVLILLAGLTVRFGVLTDPGRAVVAHMLEGRKVGRFGRLHLEGLQGDVFGNFSVRRLSIVDAKGEWLQARDVALRWSAHELVARVFHAHNLRATVVQVLRRPVIEPPGPPGGGLPVSIVIDDLKTRLETLPAFSARQGVWEVAGQAEIRRGGGGANGRLDAQSRLHAGDGLALLFRVDRGGRILVRADAVEGTGGALAGALGLPANQRFFVHARVDGSSTEAGTLSVTTEAGGRQPLTATGRWDRTGASLDARVLLDVSTLTAPYALRAGPEARVTLTARNIRDDLFQLDGAVRARDATILVKGPLDWRRRTAQGLALDLQVAELRRWVEVVQAGPSRATGTLSGTLDRWRFEGRVLVERLDQLGYRLARAAGPATLSRTQGEFRLQADLTTAGGAGEGLTPALLGPSPHIKLDGSRLDGGQILFRSLDVDGAGLKLTATGDRSLLGVLNFRGDLALSRLERANPGAKGVVRARWTARQAGPNPWAVNFDARGEGFASGYPELDRLLGPVPRLAGDATYGVPGLQVSRAQITGAALQASLRGALDPQQRIALDVDWSAQGPFTVGPVEIAGQAKGAGKVGGRLPYPTVDLAADLASLDFGQLVVSPAHLTLGFATEGGLNGRIGLTGSSAWGPATGRAQFRFVANGLDLTEIATDAGGVKTAGALALRDGAPSSADLTVSAGPGALLSAGRLEGSFKITERPGGAAAQIAVDGQRLAFPGSTVSLRTVRLRAAGPWERLPFQLSLDAGQPMPWRFAGDGMLTQTVVGPATVREISLSGAGRVRQADIRTREPALFRFAAAERSARLRLAIGAGQAELDAREAGGAFEAHGQLGGVELAAFASDYLGRVSGTLNLSGRGDRLTGGGEASIEGGRNRDAPADVALTAKLRADLVDTRLRVVATATNPQGLTSNLDLDIPAEATASPFRVALVRNRPLNGSFNAQGELRPLWDILGGGGISLSGKGSVQAGLSGTINEPRATGEAGIEGGRLQDSGTGLDLRNVSAQAAFDRGAVNLRRFSGDDGRGGTMSGSGDLSLASEGTSSLTLELRRFQVIDNDLARASASGQVVVTRDATGKAQLKGALTIDRADITANPPVPTGVVAMDVIEINKPGDEPPGATVRRGPQIALDVGIRAPRGVLVRGNGLDAEFSVDAHVGGTTAAPVLTGLARVVRGSYEFAGKRFEFDDRGTIRLASNPEGIRLDLTAVRDDPALRAIVQIRGTAARPEIMLSSTPVLPPDEVLSQVLFGRSAAQLSPLEAAQLASAVTALATGGGLDVLGGLRQLAGLDRLALAGGGSGTAATVSGGKYLTNDVYLELTGGGADGPTAQVEWRVRRNFSIVSTVGTRGDARLSIRFRKDR